MPGQKKKVTPWVFMLGGLGVGSGLYLLTRKKEKPSSDTPLPPEPPPPTPPTGIPEIDPILNEIDQAIAKLREVIEFLRKSVEGADELIKTNEAVISEAQNALNEIKPKVVNKTATQQDAEKLLAVLEKIVTQFNASNSFLVALVENVRKAIQELENTVNELEKQISDLKYQLEPVPVAAQAYVSGAVGGRYGTRSQSAPLALSLPQTVSLSGVVEALGALPFGCANSAVRIRDRVGKILFETGQYSCCHFFSCDRDRKATISKSLSLATGMYTVEASIWGYGGASALGKVEYKTARFLVST